MRLSLTSPSPYIVGCTVLVLAILTPWASAHQQDQAVLSQCERALTAGSANLSKIIQAGVPISQEQSLVLFTKWKNASSVSEKTALEKALFNGHVRMLGKIARKWWRRNRHLEFEDFFQNGLLNFRRGLEKYNPSKSKLSSYLWRWFEAGVIDFVLADFYSYTRGIPQYISTNYFMNVGQVHNLLTKKQMPLTPENLALEFNDIAVRKYVLLNGSAPHQNDLKRFADGGWVVTPDQVQLLEVALKNFRKQKEKDQSSDGDIIPEEYADSGPLANEQIEQTENQHAIHNLFLAFRSTLKNNRERAVFDLRIVAEPDEKLALIELAHRPEFNVSRQAVQQMEQSILKRLELFMRDRHAENLL